MKYHSCFLSVSVFSNSVIIGKVASDEEVGLAHLRHGQPAGGHRFPEECPLNRLERSYLFGDSLVDNGNTHSVHPRIPKRSTNEGTGGEQEPRLAVEYLAKMLGFKIPRMSGHLTGPVTGNNFACAEARTISSAAMEENDLILNLPNQVKAFLGATNKDNLKNALFVFIQGANDVLHAIHATMQDPSTDGEAHVRSAAKAVARIVNDVINAGARHIVVSKIPDLGKTPFASILGADVAGLATGLCQVFNKVLSEALTDVECKTGRKIVQYEAFPSTDKAVDAGLGQYSSPCSYFMGSPFTNSCAAQERCANPDCILPDAEDFLFYDEIHPSAAFHNFVANDIFTALRGACKCPDYPRKKMSLCSSNITSTSIAEEAM